MEKDKRTRYAVRRALVFIPLLVLCFFLLTSALRAMTSPPSYSCVTHAVAVEAGDTLYELAHEYCSGDVRAVIDVLVAMYGTDIDTWQTIHLPIASGDDRAYPSP